MSCSRGKSVLAGVCSLLLMCGLFSDEVVTYDGKTYEGVSSIEGEYVVIVSEDGQRHEVHIRKIKSFRKFTKKDKSDSSGEEAAKKDDEETQSSGRRITSSDSALGSRMVKYVKCPKCDGSGVLTWITCNRCTRYGRPGYVQLLDMDKWELCTLCEGHGKIPGVPCEFCGRSGKVREDRLKPPEKKKPEPRKKSSSMDKLLGSKMVEKIPCPDCEGTGVGWWLRCNQCSRSSRPGWVNLGEKYIRCNRCGGRGKVPVLPCKRCKRTGKVNPDDPWPPVRKPPKGYIFCTQCNSEGCDKWVTCERCGKRGAPPGYLYLGDRVDVCNICGGLGKIAMRRCSGCRGRGVVKDPNK